MGVTDAEIRSKYTYNTTEITKRGDTFEVAPKQEEYEFITDRRVPRLGVMLVGWGGNNGTTVTGGVIANREKMMWRTKRGTQEANYFGSLTQASTVRLGMCDGQECFVPFKKLLPMVEPSDIVLGGWDISAMPLDQAMERAGVLELDLRDQLASHLQGVIPLPAIFDQSFVASNQASRADNVITGTKQEQLDRVREDIRHFKEVNGAEKVIVLWTANTERYSKLGAHNATKDALLQSIAENGSEVSPSTLYAVACILEGVPFINGAPQNTFVPGVVELAVERHVTIGGDDFKSGQTKMKSVLTDFLVSAGIKPTAIVSYNHLGNNDGKNLSAPETFRSKEISKSDVVNDMIQSNGLLFGEGEHPDHCVVIKYVPYVGDSKRAMDEYTSEIFLGGTSTIVMHNTCEDSLLAAPLILDLVLITEVCDRIKIKKEGEPDSRGFHPVNVMISYLTKAPFVPKGHPVINALSKQRSMLENIFKACVGLPPESNMYMECK